MARGSSDSGACSAQSFRRHSCFSSGSVTWACLLLIGLLNLVVLAGIVRVFASMRRGEYDEAELERQLANRGFFYRFFGRWMKAITKEWHLYPVAVVFPAHPLVRDHLPAGPVHRGHDVHGHHRRAVHEPGHHRAVRS